MAWMRKLRQMARLYQVEKDLVILIPSFLEERAYAVYEQLPDTVQVDPKLLEQSLYDAFSVRRYGAFEKLRTRKMKDDETVDIFLADIKRLAELSLCSSETLIQNCFFLWVARPCATVA